MEADQWRKRLNGSRIVGCRYYWEQFRVKNKNLGSPQDNLSMKPHISLEWDGNQQRVVANKEQIGISWRGLRPFIDLVPHCHNILADVLFVPPEIFELDNLAEVLSYEVWQTHLSENERNFLMQFLPKGPETQQVVQALIAGDNFHFGNPFLKWGASLCSGNFHPDAVIHQERFLKADKEGYYSELQKYHNNMVGYLLRLKDSWASCDDPEKEIVQKIWRSEKDAEKRIFSHANDSRFCELEENVEATSESCSWVVDEKACSSDNQNNSVMKGRELEKRLDEQGVTNDKCGSPLIASDDVLNVGARSRKGDNLQKHNIHCSDGSKYMSYFKISKKQHQLVKSMKQSGKSIQSRSLNCVLGDLDSFHVQPYEVFVEEERKKLHMHWLQLTNQDLPTVYAIWRERKLQRQQMINSLEQEMKEKMKLLIEEEKKESPKSLFKDQKDNQVTNHESSMEDEDDFVPGSPINQPTLQISSSYSGHECDPMNMDSKKNLVISKYDALSDASHFSGALNTADVAVTHGVPISSGVDVWPAASMSHAYYDTTASHVYTSAGELSIAHPQVNKERQARLIDVESDLHEDSGKLLHRHTNLGSFSTYPNQDRNNLLQSFFKDQQMISYPHKQKQTGLDFHPPNNVLMEDGQFPERFQEQLQLSLPPEQKQKSQNEVYIQQNIFSDGGRYLIPRQEHSSHLSMQDWAVNPVRMSAPLQSHLNGGELLSQNWFSGEHQVWADWTGSDGPRVLNQIGSGSNTDQSLFSVLSHCNPSHSGTPFDLISSADQFVLSRNYGMVGGGTPRISNVASQSAHPLDRLSRREATNSLPTDDMGWINLPIQNSALHDPMGKPFLGSWNQ